MKRSRILLIGAVGTVCAMGGAAAGIAETSASSTPHPAARLPRLGAGIAGAHRGLLRRMGPLKDAAGGPVHSEAVVPNDKGGFDTITIDRGKLASVSGNQLTITEGTPTATYKTVTLTIPSGATVRRDREQAQLSDLKAGDRVLVAQGPAGTLVMAHDPHHSGLGKRERLAPGAPPPGVPNPGSPAEPPRP